MKDIKISKTKVTKAFGAVKTPSQKHKNLKSINIFRNLFDNICADNITPDIVYISKVKFGELCIFEKLQFYII